MWSIWCNAINFANNIFASPGSCSKMCVSYEDSIIYNFTLSFSIIKFSRWDERAINIKNKFKWNFQWAGNMYDVLVMDSIGHIGDENVGI
jgi:hypothetical protein